jgi:hypothetical protein
MGAMSKSKKKQTARKRAQEDVPTELPLVEEDDFDEPDDTPSIALPERKPQPLNEALYEQAVAAATAHGVMREEGEALAYLYNGDTLSMKFVEAPEDTDEPDRLMIAAFRQGVVFQTEGQTQVVYQPGDWEQEIARLADTPAADVGVEE